MSDLVVVPSMRPTMRHVTLLLFLAGCATHASPISGADGEVTDAMLLHMIAGEEGQLVLQEQTRHGHFDSAKECRWAVNADPALEESRHREAALAFCIANEANYTMSELGVSVPHTVWTEEMNSRTFSDGRECTHIQPATPFSEKREVGTLWSCFWREYPDSFGIWSVSRPGFSSDGAVAAIFMSWSQAGLRGDGRMRLFERLGDRWVKLDVSPVAGSWMS